MYPAKMGLSISRMLGMKLMNKHLKHFEYICFLCRKQMYLKQLRINQGLGLRHALLTFGTINRTVKRLRTNLQEFPPFLLEL